MDTEATQIRALAVECCTVLEGCNFIGPAGAGAASTLEHLHDELLLLAAHTEDRDAHIDALGLAGLIEDVLRATPVDDPDLVHAAAS